MNHKTKITHLISLFTSINLVGISQVMAKPVVYDFTVNVTQGALKGQSFTGVFSYDDEKLTNQETQTIGVKEGLKVCMNFIKMQNETNDVDYPQFPQLTFQEGKPESLNFWVEKEAPRQLWWNTNGWIVNTSIRDQKNSMMIDCQ